MMQLDLGWVLGAPGAPGRGLKKSTSLSIPRDRRRAYNTALRNSNSVRLRNVEETKASAVVPYRVSMTPKFSGSL